MSGHAFFIAGDRVIHIANPCGAGLQYRARALTLAPGEATAVERHESAETVLVVRSGTVEVMVDGATGTVVAGGFVRIAAGRHFALRALGDEPARLLKRTAPPTEARDARRIIVEIAAA